MTLEHVGYAQYDHRVWGTPVHGVEHYDVSAVLDFGAGVVGLVVESRLWPLDDTLLIPFRVMVFHVEDPATLLFDQEFAFAGERAYDMGIRTLALGRNRVLLLSTRGFRCAVATWNGMSVVISPWINLSVVDPGLDRPYGVHQNQWDNNPAVRMYAERVELVLGPNNTPYAVAWGEGLALCKLTVSVDGGVVTAEPWNFALHALDLTDNHNIAHTEVFANRNLLHLLFDSSSGEISLATLRFDGGGLVVRSATPPVPPQPGWEYWHASRPSVWRDGAIRQTVFRGWYSKPLAEHHFIEIAPRGTVRTLPDSLLPALPSLDVPATWDDQQRPENMYYSLMGGHVVRALPGPIVLAVSFDALTQTGTTWVGVGRQPGDPMIPVSIVRHDEFFSYKTFFTTPRVCVLASGHFLIIQGFSDTTYGPGGSTQQIHPARKQAIAVHVFRWLSESNLASGDQRAQGYFS